MKTPSHLRALSSLPFVAFRRSRVFAILAAISVSPAHAILDTNNNGLSDLWEKQHNNGNLFPNTFLATNDEDQDGWANAKEAIAGTDPFKANPPDGIVAVEITPSLVPGAFTLSWPTLIGKNYQIKVSTDLVTWTNLGTPITTTQSTHTIGINTTQPNNSIPSNVFWQVTVTDLDSDLDGLTNSEELALGTDPFSADTDEDGMPDSIEIEIGTGPTNSDSDNNGVTDDEEDSDADGLQNSVDADPADSLVNWQKTGRPTFAVIEIPVTKPEELHYVDHSPNGTILLRRTPPDYQYSAVIIDKERNVREKDFIWVTHLHDDLVPLRQSTDTSDGSLYDPLTDTFYPWECPINYEDMISDVRDGLLVGINWLNHSIDELMRISPNGTALPGQDTQASTARATIDKDGNIVSNSHYWKKEPNGNYIAKLLPNSAETYSTATSAIHKQVTGGVEKQWTLVARPGIAGLAISQDNAAFTAATKRFGAKNFRAVTRQGWIFDENFNVWNGIRWEPLLDILGEDYSEAELLGINDEGLAVAKIKKGNGPLRIGLLVPVEIQVKNDANGVWINANELKVAKWENAFTENEFRNEHPEGMSDIYTDVDRFRIRINTENLPEELRKVFISTIGASDAEYNDNATEVRLERDFNPYGPSDGFTSKPIILVADTVDNKFKNDNQLNDQTHIAALGSHAEFRIKQANGDLVGRLPVHKKKNIHLDLILLWQGENGPSELALNKMSEDIKVTREIYAQVGIDVHFTTGAYQVNSNVDLSDGLTLSTEQNPGVLHTEGEVILNAFGTPNNQTDVIGLYIDGRIYSASSRGGEVQGTAFWDNAEVMPHTDYPNSYWNNTVSATYKGTFLISTSRLSKAVLAHELGHVLGLLHPNDEKVPEYRQAKRNLLTDGVSYEDSYRNDTKRLMLFQEKRMHNSQFIKNANNN